MSLPPGTRIGVYEVVDLVGVGGMGQVYRARDSRLGRDVAIKTLPEEFVRDAERLARFEREAKVLAQLNHPHIASIYGLETGDVPALVMEMVEGETLADRLQLGPVPLDEAIAIAHQIADALEHAHGQGIVHRDLKPANIKVGAREAAPKVKVLDFGLAKAMMADPSSASSISAVSSPTITSPMNLTRAGLILGTAAYMSPEQARGKHVDQRADIWAFGCVLYEMLTGERAFEGEEIADVLARVIQSEPDWTLLPVSTPPAIKTLLQRCLRKDPSKRIHSIADARIDLDESTLVPAPGVAAGPAPPIRSRWPALLGAAAIGAALAGGAAVLSLPPRTAPADSHAIRFTVPMPDGWTLARTQANGRLNFAVSPDGEKLAVVLAGKGQQKIFVKRFDEAAFRELPGTDDGRLVFWAPDSQRVGFATGTNIRRTDLSGSGSQSMFTLSRPLVGASWGAGDHLIFAQGPGQPLSRMAVAGGAAEPLGAFPKDAVGWAYPGWLSGESSALFNEARGPGRVAVMGIQADGATREIAELESNGGGSLTALYRSSTLLVSRSESSGRSILTAQPFDPASLRTTGEATVLFTDLNPAFSASETGVLAFGGGQFTPENFVVFDARGSATTVSKPFSIYNFDWSLDERYVIFQQAGGGLHLLDLTRGVTSRVSDQGSDPIWSPDQKQIAFSMTNNKDPRGIYVMPAFGGARQMLYPSDQPAYIEDWSRDGQWLTFVQNITAKAYVLSLSKGASPVPFEGSPDTNVDEMQFSPDAHWIAYALNGLGGGEVFLRTVPPTGERWQVSVSGGAQPRWRGDGKALYYLTLSGTMMMVDVTATPGSTPQFSKPRALFDTGIQVSTTLDQFRVNKDGTRFLVRRPDSAEATRSELQVIVNWPALLKKQ